MGIKVLRLKSVALAKVEMIALSHTVQGRFTGLVSGMAGSFFFFNSYTTWWRMRVSS